MPRASTKVRGFRQAAGPCWRDTTRAIRLNAVGRSAVVADDNGAAGAITGGGTVLTLGSGSAIDSGRIGRGGENRLPCPSIHVEIEQVDDMGLVLDLLRDQIDTEPSQIAGKIREVDFRRLPGCSC